MQQQLLVVLLFSSSFLFAQVGIGTSTPNSELEIKAPGSLPSLELNPQIAPLGTAMGQISVIGDELYLYDNNRLKWLTISTANFNFGLEGNISNRTLEYAGDITASGPRMPKNGTIVYLTLNSSGGNPTKGATLDVVSSAGVTTSYNFQYVGGSRIYTQSNINVSAGDQLFFKINTDGASIQNPTVVLWVKWRK